MLIKLENEGRDRASSAYIQIQSGGDDQHVFVVHFYVIPYNSI